MAVVHHARAETIADQSDAAALLELELGVGAGGEQQEGEEGEKATGHDGVKNGR